MLPVVFDLNFGGYDGVAVATLAVAYEFQPEPVVGRLGFIVQQGDTFAQVAEGKVGPSVVIVIRPGQPAANEPFVEINAGLCRNISKVSATVAREELGFLSGRKSFDLFAVSFDVAISDSNIEVAVEIGIEKDRAEFEGDKLGAPKPDAKLASSKRMRPDSDRACSVCAESS